MYFLFPIDISELQSWMALGRWDARRELRTSVEWSSPTAGCHRPLGPFLQTRRPEPVPQVQGSSKASNQHKAP